MFQNAYLKLDGDDTAELLARVNPLLDTAPFRVDTATVLSVPVSFYPGYYYADITHHGTLPALSVKVVYNQARAVVMTSRNEPIYALNTSVPLSLTDSNVADYVRFFFMHVRGQQGRFLIIDMVDDINWKEDPAASARKALAKMIVPLSVTGKTPEGSWKLSASMIFKDSLFQTQITVTPSGDVSLSDEELLVESLPVLEDTLGS
ncbi:MAG: hypothetical protein J0L77_01070 [Alphaproteobacteria bacterium]|nr:hypothetical protein [Alphaproteobacteria bacterium]